MLGDFTKAVDDAVMSSDAHQDQMCNYYLTPPKRLVLLRFCLVC